MLSSEYVRGIVDGEGSFTVYVRDPHQAEPRTRRVKVEPKFIVKLQAQDLLVLEGLKEFFRCGKIYQQPDKRMNHQDCFRFEVFNRSELSGTIIPFFMEHLPQAPSKLHDFKLFAEIISLLQQKIHTTDTGLETIWNLKHHMHRGSPDAGNPHVRWEHQS